MAANMCAVLLIKKTCTAEAFVHVDSRPNKPLEDESPLAPINAEDGVLKSDVDVIRSPAFAMKIIQATGIANAPEFREVLKASLIEDARSMLIHWLGFDVGDLLDDEASAGEVARRDQEKTIDHFLANLNVEYESRSYRRGSHTAALILNALRMSPTPSRRPISIRGFEPSSRIWPFLTHRSQ